jgi:hypothetical protein
MGISIPPSVGFGMNSELVIAEIQREDEDYEICGSCGEDLDDCTCAMCANCEMLLEDYETKYCSECEEEYKYCYQDGVGARNFSI